MQHVEAPDFGTGFPIVDIGEGMLVSGRVGPEPAILTRIGREFFVVGATCTHYHAPLANGLVVEATLRCPLHHACFSLRTGEATCAPALDPIDTWRVELASDKVYAREKLSRTGPTTGAVRAPSPGHPRSVVIVGGGGAALAAADMLRRRGYAGPVTMVSADESAPYDRPNVSKDYLAGTAPEAWMPLRGAQFYTDRQIELHLGVRVTSIDTSDRLARLDNGRELEYGALLLATGADPVKPAVSATPGSRIFYLRSLADSRAIVSAAGAANSAVVMGASFIGLEVAASLRTRGIDVHVVGLEAFPLQRVLGPEVGGSVQRFHESKGVTFHLGQSITHVDARSVTLSDGVTIPSDFVVMGVGVKPALALAEQAGLTIDRGVVTNRFLETSTPGVFAAGDIARWPDPHSGERIRVEHWVVAQRHGQIAARNMLGAKETCRIVPFFWTQHYEMTINYVGHAEQWDSVAIDGTLESRDCAISFLRGAQTLAVATISRDIQSLRAEQLLEASK